MIYFASDIHLGGGGCRPARETERRFVAWLDRVAKDAEAVVLVGDVFDFWFEYREVVPKGFVRVLGRLAAMTDRGIRVVFFTGNHDMWIGDYLTRECGIEIHTTPEVMTLAGKRLFVAHGDNMNIENQPLLKLLNATFRSRTLYRLFSWLIHPDWLMRFGHWWSGSSRKKHNAAGVFDISLTEPLVDYARDYARTHEIDYFVFGHMHFPRDYNEQGLRVLNLGCWEKNPAYAVLDDAGRISLQTLEQS